MRKNTISSYYYLFFVIVLFFVACTDNQSSVDINTAIRVTNTTSQITAPTVAVYHENIWVVWDEYDELSESADVFMTVSHDNGKTFSKPRNITNHGGAENPTIAVTDEGVLYLGFMAWADEPIVDDFYTAWMEVHRSTDGGETWTMVGQTPDPEKFPVQPTLPAMSISPDGRTILFSWRDATPPEYIPNDMPVQIEGTESIPLWASVSFDGGITFSDPQPAAPSACSCCGSKAFMMGDTPAIAYRGLEFLDGEHDERNPAMVYFKDATWSPPQEIHDDNFQMLFTGCPASGPGADELNGVTQIAWWTGAAEREGFWLASGSNGVFSEPTLIKESSSQRGNLEVAINDMGQSLILLGEAEIDHEHNTDQAVEIPYVKLFVFEDGQVMELKNAQFEMYTTYAPTYAIAAVPDGFYIVWVEVNENGQQIMLRKIESLK